MTVNAPMQARVTNRLTRDLPADPDTTPQPRAVHGAAYSHVQPTPVARPQLLAWSDDVGQMLGVARPSGDDDWLDILAGNAPLPGSQPYATCYGGHQFGNWAGQLGDGRAISLGEVCTPAGQHWEMQLKGAGLTPYSRGADGRAVLRSSLREFLCSEAMHHLGVPTSRALSLVGSGESVVRDMFYDGNPQPEPGAIVCRVAPSFLRPGHFELPAARGDTALLTALVDHAIRAHFPQIDPDDPNRVVAWYELICQSTARLVAEWLRVGFVHGVMNTDNLSIHGITLDYGPYGWLEPYDPSWTPNTTDAAGRRYCFGHQPTIAQWNLSRFGGALARLPADTEALNDALSSYARTFETTNRDNFARKLGLRAFDATTDSALMDEMFQIMSATETDYCLFFRCLADVDPDAQHAVRRQALAPAYYDPDALDGHLVPRLDAWLDALAKRWQADDREPAERRTAMNAVNPKFVPRNYLAQQAIDAAQAGDLSVLDRLMQVLSRPYDEQPDAESFAARRPEWARNKAGCSALSCSS